MTSKPFNPKISVMIVTYNQKDFIADTIESVLNQHYSHLEIIIADDASTDGTVEIIQRYAMQYPQTIIPIYNEKNVGITNNCNIAFFACSGEFIAILGGDDLFLPGKLAAQVQLFQDNTVTLVYHPVEIFLHQTGEVLFISNLTPNEDIKDVYDLIEKGGVPGASSVMVRKSACPTHGFDPQLPIVSDWIFFIEVALKGEIRKLDGVYGRYRKHGNGASEKSYDLLAESLKTLVIVQERYPGDARLIAACKNGAFRYVLGELFRQILKSDKEKIISLKPYLFSSSVGIKRGLVFVVFQFLRVKMLLPLYARVLIRFKDVLKRRGS